MPAPEAPITLNEPAEPPASPSGGGLDPGTVREMSALLFLLLGAATASAGGFLINLPVGMFVMGGLLLALGVLLGLSS